MVRAIWKIYYVPCHVQLSIIKNVATVEPTYNAVHCHAAVVCDIQASVLSKLGHNMQ